MFVRVCIVFVSLTVFVFLFIACYSCIVLIRIDARHTACTGLIQQRVPHENAIDRRSLVVWGANWALKELKPRQLYER